MSAHSNHMHGIVPSLEELLKLEYMVASTGFTLLPKQPVHSVLAGKHASKLRGRGLDFEEVRKYVAGDDIRNIDWRVTARTRQTYTKVFTEEKEKPVLVVCDMTPGMFFGSRLYTKSFVAAQLAAVSAFKVLKNGDRFGGLIFNEESCEVIAPQRSRKAVLRYLKKVVTEAEGLSTSPREIVNKEYIMDRALMRTASLATHDHVILIISDFHQMSPRSNKHLYQLSLHNDVILAQITDPLEEKLPEDKLVLSDGNMQLLWEARKKNASKKYEKTFRDEQKEFLLDMKKHGIPVMKLNTTESTEDQLRALFSSKLKKKKL